MPQRMGGDIRLNIRLLGIMLDQLPKALSAHGLSGTVCKKHIRLLVFKHLFPCPVQIPFHRRLGRRAKGNDSLLVAVPAENEVHLHVDIGKGQGNQLRHPDSRGVEKLQHGLIADFLGAVPGRLIQKPHHLVGRHDFRRLLFNLRRLKLIGDILRHQSLLHHIVIERFQGGNVAGHGSRRELAVLQIFHIIDQILRRYILNLLNPS